MLQVQYRDKQWSIAAQPATHNNITNGMSAAVLYYFHDVDDPSRYIPDEHFALGWFTIAKAYQVPCGLRLPDGSLISYMTHNPVSAVGRLFWRTALLTDWGIDDVLTALLHGAEVTPAVVASLPHSLPVATFDALWHSARYRVKKDMVRWAMGVMRPELLTGKHVDMSGSPSIPCGQLLRQLGSPSYLRSVASLPSDHIERLTRLRADLQYITQELQTVAMTMGVSVYCQVLSVLDGESSPDTIHPDAANALAVWQPQLAVPVAPVPVVNVTTMNRGQRLLYYISSGNVDAIVAHYEPRDLIDLKLADQAHIRPDGSHPIVPRAILMSTFIYSVPTQALALLLAKESIPQLHTELQARIDSRIQGTTRTTPQGVTIPVALDVRPGHIPSS